MSFSSLAALFHHAVFRQHFPDCESHDFEVLKYSQTPTLIPHFFQSSGSNSASGLDNTTHIQPLFNTAADGTPLGPNGQPLPPAIQPPPGSVTKLAPNATLIDLNKIKKDHDGEKPFKIEQVTVLIDETDDVKVSKLSSLYELS